MDRSAVARNAGFAMKHGAIPLPVALAVVSGAALAQGAADPMAQLRACSLMERADRLECLDKLSRGAASQARPAPQEDGWTVSQTTSPVDYMPIATATTSSRPVGSGSAMQLSIRCRGGRTELAVQGPAITGRGADYVIYYRVDDAQPVQIAAAVPAFGAGVAFKGDTVPLLQSLPEQGDLTIRLSPRVGTAHDGIFSLAGLQTVRGKMAAACKWPHAVAKPNN
jgi:hypothetical protein